ncbi:hypothetical protein K458DRAFT_377196 [Lentithecium fluviatile CBS 122367]|uniref:ARM repeat-containing protein n=1 Tax=Lentithecium fluviatile CBS 122367 TaxID=1168545 RepID=A0A6G1IJP0_9PLEO|nr:hypothetical protein K458DRAFT_377196 [Lentithecium fluviatile CBS 122367]
MERQQTFFQLKAASVEVLQATASLPQRPSARSDLTKALTALSSTLQTVTAIPGALDARLAEYVFVPISQVLRISRTVPVRALELCLECISILLKAGWGGALAPELSGQLLILFTFMAKPSSAENGIAGSSEELQTLALKCIGELFTEVSRTTPGKQQLTATANIPALGEAVLVILDSVTGSNSNPVKLQAVTTMSSLITAIDDKDALASFLPRIVSSLTKVLTPSSSNRASFRVLERGLVSLSALFTRLISDRETKDLPKTGPQSSQDTSKVVRSSSWLQATASQIKIALANILKLRNHNKSEVRQALLGLCLTVIQECRTSLADCVSMVIETMVTLAGRGESSDTVEKDLKIMLSTDDKLSDLLRESLHGWIISLPRLMQSKDDAGRRQIIHQISVTLRLLADNNVMVNDLLAVSLRDGVSAVLTDAKGTSIVETASNATVDSGLVLSRATSASFEPLRLRLKGQEEMMKEFKLLLGELARSDTAVTVTEDLVNGLDVGSEESRLASFWLSVNLLRDTMAANPPLGEFIDIGASHPQEELLDNLYSHSLTILNERDAATASHWHFPALAFEVLALQATKYKTEFRAELSETLYPILHHLGSANPGLRSHAITCLNIIAESCDYSSASELVIANVDYIVNAVGLRLSYGDVSPQAPQVLLMMMRLCGPSLLPYLDDLVGSIFGALERYHGYPKLVELLFAVLKGMAEEGVKAPQLAITDSSDQPSDIKKQDDETIILEFFAKIRKLEADFLATKEDIEELPAGSFPQKPWKELTEEEFKQQTTLPGDQDPPPTDEKPPEDPPPPAPRTFDILLKISDLTQHYLTSSSPALRTSLLSLLHTTIPALARHENSFLPLINTLWPVLLPRLEDPEAYIVANALDIVGLMCTHAGNFMKTRIESAWELLKSIYKRTITKKDTSKPQTSTRKPTRLIDLSNITQSKSGTSIHTSTGRITTSSPSNDTFLSRPELYVNAPTRMIWDALVRLLCAISQHVHIQDVLFDDVLDMLDPVLEKPEVKKAMESRNADAVWLRLYKKSKRAAEQKEMQWELPVELGGPVKMPQCAKDLGFVEL